MNNTTFIILAFTLPFLMTVLGSSFVFFFKKTSKTVSCITIGLASGIMLSAAIWSLLLPAMESASNWGDLSIIPVVAGLLIGCIFMLVLDLICAKFFKISKEKSKPYRFFTAITIHNIPEGMSVGFAVGTAFASQSILLTPFMFALGIALQNLPEGLATALPLNSSLQNRTKSFFLSTLSGIVEPIFAIASFFLASTVTFLMPWLLAFSAGTMIYVILNELMPEIFKEKSILSTWMFIIGFVIMMVLDVCL